MIAARRVDTVASLQEQQSPPPVGFEPAPDCATLARPLCQRRVGVCRCALAPTADVPGRVLLTKDRHLVATVADAAPVVLVQGDGIDEIARTLRTALDIDWHRAPFTRCIVDNRPLEEAPADYATRVPERSRAAGGPLHVCPECGRLYWPGSHVRRMQQRLAAWQQDTPLTIA